ELAASASAVKTSTMETLTLETSTKARAAPRGVAVRDASVINSAKRTGMQPRLGVRPSGRMKRGTGPSTVESSMVEIPTAMKAVPVYECSAVRDIGVVIVNNRPMAPVASPVVPSPPDTGKKPSWKPQAERNAWTRRVEYRVGIPARPHH